MPCPGTSPSTAMALSRSMGVQGLRPAGHRGQVAVVHAHPVRQLLQGEAVLPGRRPKLALRLALALSLFRRNRDDGANRPNRQTESSRGKKPWRPFLAVAALGLLAVVLLPATALANDPDDDQGWRLDEIYFVPLEPVPGRRIFVERLAVSGDTAAVTLRAAHDLDLKVRVFGGRSSKTLRMGANTTLTAGQAKSYNLSLDGSFSLLHLLLGGLPGPLRGGVPEELSNPLSPIPCPGPTAGCAIWS